jgi:hypothetical protein
MHHTPGLDREWTLAAPPDRDPTNRARRTVGRDAEPVNLKRWAGAIPWMVP